MTDQLLQHSPQGPITRFVATYQQRAAELAKRNGKTAADCMADAIHQIAAEQPDLYAEHDILTLALGDKNYAAHLTPAERQAVEKFHADQQRASAEDGKPPAPLGGYETLGAKILAEQFNGDPSKWSEAYSEAATQRPDLYNAYENFEADPAPNIGVNAYTGATFTPGAISLARQILAQVPKLSPSDRALIQEAHLLGVSRSVDPNAHVVSGDASLLVRAGLEKAEYVTTPGGAISTRL